MLLPSKTFSCSSGGYPVEFYLLDSLYQYRNYGCHTKPSSRFSQRKNHFPDAYFCQTLQAIFWRTIPPERLHAHWHSRLPGSLHFPAIILSYAWMLAPILLIDKGVNPMEALTLSNKYTYGNKFSYFLVSIALFISLAILFGLISLISPELGMITSILLTPVTGASLIAAVYKRLVLSQINEA